MKLESYDIRISMNGPVVYLKYTNGTSSRVLLQTDQAKTLRKDIKKVLKVCKR